MSGFVIPTSKIDPTIVRSKNALYYNAYAVLRTRNVEHKQGEVKMCKDHKHVFIHDQTRYNKYEISEVEIEGWYYVSEFGVWRSPKKVS